MRGPKPDDPGFTDRRVIAGVGVVGACWCLVGDRTVCRKVA